MLNPFSVVMIYNRSRYLGVTPQESQYYTINFSFTLRLKKNKVINIIRNPLKNVFTLCNCNHETKKKEKYSRNCLTARLRLRRLDVAKCFTEVVVCGGEALRMSNQLF